MICCGVQFKNYGTTGRVFKKLVSHSKEYGFVFPSSDIYDGLAAVYDYGQMGVELKTTLRNTGGTAWCCCTRTWWD